MPEVLAGYSALVTGGASGIGRGVVERFLAEGAQLTVLDTAPGGLEREIDDPGLQVVEGDVTRAVDNDRAVAAALERYGRLDVVVANAGISDGFQPFHATSGEALEELVDQLHRVNVRGVILTLRAALRPLVRHRGSAIVTLSNASRLAGGGGVAYTASKHAALGVVRQLAYELAPRVRVNAVAPGGTLTDLRTASVLGTTEDGRGRRANPEEGLVSLIEDVTPLRVAAEPSDHVGAYVLLASREQSRATTGAVIDTDAGLGVRGVMGVRGGDDLANELGIALEEDDR